MATEPSNQNDTISTIQGNPEKSNIIPINTDQDLAKDDEHLITWDLKFSKTIEEVSEWEQSKRDLVKSIKDAFSWKSEYPQTTVDFYRIGKVLGQGAFGRVNLAMHKLC